MKTITLVRPQDVSTFEVRERWTIEDFDYPTACALFGQPLVDSYLAWKANPPQKPYGTVTVVSIDSVAGVITFDEPCTTSAQPRRSQSANNQEGT